MPTYEALTAENKSKEMSFDYDELTAKIDIVKNKVVTRNDDGDVIREVDYYKNRRSEISFEWLNGYNVKPDQNYIWHANMPLPLFKCREVYAAAEKGLMMSCNYLM